MKIFIPAIAASLMLVTSCNADKKDEIPNDVPITTVMQAAETEGKKTIIAANQVPDSVVMSFNEKYPKVEVVEWTKYEPIETDEMDMDRQYYYVVYKNNGADYTSWYNNTGEWVKTSTKIAGNSQLPDAVNKTINDQYPGYEVVEIDKENDKDMDMYEIELKKGEEKAKLKVLPDGTVFKRKN